MEIQPIDLVDFPQRKSIPCIRNTISNLRSYLDRGLICKVATYVAVFFSSLFLIVSLIGIPLFVLGYREFVEQKQEERYVNWARSVSQSIEAQYPLVQKAFQDIQQSIEERKKINAKMQDLEKRYQSLELPKIIQGLTSQKAQTV